MKISKIKKGLVLVGILSGMLVAGCELIVDFDRTRIPVGTADVNVPDATPPVPTTDASPTDAGSDASTDAAADASDADAS